MYIYINFSIYNLRLNEVAQYLMLYKADNLVIKIILKYYFFNNFDSFKDSINKQRKISQQHFDYKIADKKLKISYLSMNEVQNYLEIVRI